MGSKLFPIILRELQEYQKGMALIDILNKLEKLNLLESSDHWIDYRKLRNQLTYEYPNNYDEILAAVTLSIQVYEAMKQIYLSMLDRIYSKET